MRHTAYILALLAAVSLWGCEPKAGRLVDDPPLPPRPLNEVPPLEFQPITIVPDVDVATRKQPPEKSPVLVAPDAAWVAKDPAKWTHIIVHHSATDFGNAAAFDRLHRQRNWDELGYHFVIDNGNGGADGQVEVGPRWIKQKHGAHCRPSQTDANYWNEHGIGVCLVGDFTRSRPSEAQMNAAARLVAFLMKQSGIPRANILGHNQVPGAKTRCPGERFPYSDLFARVAAQ